MTLTSLQFIFLVLPGLLCLWWLTPRKLHPWLLLSYSLWLYWTLTGWHGPVVMVTLLLSDWVLAGIAVKARDKSPKRICVIVSAIKNIGSALLFTFIQNKLAFPLGIGIYGVSGLWYVINASRGFVVWEKNPVHMLSCSSFFPSVFAGPPLTPPATVLSFLSFAGIGHDSVMDALNLSEAWRKRLSSAM